jgi:ABC-type antimicrobial peptide transport system permease subunit
MGFRMEPSSTWVASDSTRRALWVLLGAVTFLLLIAYLNIANLLLARGMSRKREIAVRTALDAGRARLVRFVMMESLLLSGFGAGRFNTILLGVFSGLALLLATTGIYGVLSYSMSRRTAEIGLRVALGAGGRSILRMALVQGMRPVLAGLASGALGAWWLSRYFTAMLFGIKPFDVATYFAVAALLLATALAACYFPGRRAMRIDPAVALRIE